MKKRSSNSVSSLPDYQGLPDSLPGEVDYPLGGADHGIAGWMALALVIIIAVTIGLPIFLQRLFGD
ncbi:MAG: hypothetical protein QM703_01140 [Gemmatales bacterium]